MPDLTEKEPLLEQYAAGAEVLAKEATFVQSSVRLLGQLTQDPTDEVMLPLAVDAATDPESPATGALDVLPYIQRAVARLTPNQTDPSQAENVRWTLDWRSIGQELKNIIEQQPDKGEMLTQWFLTQGLNMVETRFALPESRAALYEVVGGANEQCNDRAVQVLASMASPEFRQEKGLKTSPQHTLNGETERPAGWLRDPEFITELREHVRRRIEAGEIEPRILVAGSADRKRVINQVELSKVTTVVRPGTDLLYPERGWTEADSMLAGAINIFGGQRDTISTQTIEAAEAGEVPTQLIRFQTELGIPVTFIGSAGSDANLLRQSLIAAQYAPELFEGIDAFYGTTTAIYSQIHRAILREVAARQGIKGIPVDALGASAHAAGITRKPETLVGELTQYLKAVYAIALRTLESAEANTKLDIERRVGGAAIHGAGS